MGIYLNPGYEKFEAMRRDTYVDKTGLIAFINDRIGKPKPLVCFSRPRRFGKSFDANMLCAYYDRSCDSRFLFKDLIIAEDDSFEQHLNQYNVISFDVTGFIRTSGNRGISVSERIQNALLKELKTEFPECIVEEEDDLGMALYAVVSGGNAKFIFVIDEWDALFRECKEDKQLQRDYVLFLRSLFKNQDLTIKTVAAAYMTGILPIKKYGTESALTDFQEYTMTNPGRLAEFVGFTETEVERLCSKYQMNFEDMRTWYDGYSFRQLKHVYSPNSVMNALKEGEILNYWTQTETFESLKNYIGMDYDGLKSSIVEMLGGKQIDIRVSTFQNDMTSFHNKNDVLTLLVHLGYLAYDSAKRKARIPNLEVAEAFEDAVSPGAWGAVGKAIADSEKLLDATIREDADTAIRQIHEKQYDGALKEYIGRLLLVGINYDKKAKGAEKEKHSCVIERV